MGCSSCGAGSNGTPSGCGDKGHCSSGSCNKLNTYDWIANKEMFDPSEYNIVEVSFKKGAHKDFFINDHAGHSITGDMVVVETASGYDVGRISLSGELVRIQMKKKFTSEDRVAFKVIRQANERDLEKLEEARQLEKEAMVKARVIARTLGLDMKIGDVEFQGDKKKGTFYYTAEGRVDFRDLVKEYAREFKVKIEMRQIGARQESARIGGIGSCGRELCCSTWLSDFKSVNTAAARYQNIAINQSKLSGQCGRLKCCLNYELDTYMDALEDFPNDADSLKTKAGNAYLIKTDIFKGLLYYAYENDRMRGNIISIDTTRAKEIKKLNKKGVFPDELAPHVEVQTKSADDVNVEHGYEDVTGLIELKNEPKKKRKKKPFKKDREQPSANAQGEKQNNNQNRGPSQNKPKSNHPNQNKQNQNPSDNEGNTKPNQQSKKPRPPKPQNSSEKSTDTNQDSNQNQNPNQKQNPNPNKTSNNKRRNWNKNRKPKDGE